MLDKVLFGEFPKSVVVFSPGRVSDFVDRLNHGYTVFFLIGCALLVSTKQYVFQPIQCWTPAQFISAWEQYVENYCWVQNTYFLPVRSTILNDVGPRKEQQELSYYQWVPFILSFQAFLFFLPFGFWLLTSSASDVNVDVVLKMAAECETSDVKTRDESRKSLAHYLYSALLLQKAGGTDLNQKIKPAYLASVYIVSKLLYIVNSISQLFMLNAFLGTKTTLFGLVVLENLMKGLDWEESALFPRVTFCDFEVRDHIGQSRRYTVQCVLATNMLNEKIFLLIWFWLVFIFLVNLLSLIWWLHKLAFPSQRIHFVQSLATTLPKNQQKDSRFVRVLVSTYLSLDGVFLLRLVFTNFGAVLCAQILDLFWDECLKRSQSVHGQRKPGKTSGLGCEFHEQELESPNSWKSHRPANSPTSKSEQFQFEAINYLEDGGSRKSYPVIDGFKESLKAESVQSGNPARSIIANKGFQEYLKACQSEV